MGCWRYCECGHGQSRIDIDDLQAISYDAYSKVLCASCYAPRSDDSPEERLAVLVDEIIRLRERQNTIIKVLKYIRDLVKGAKS